MMCHLYRFFTLVIFPLLLSPILPVRTHIFLTQPNLDIQATHCSSYTEFMNKTAQALVLWLFENCLWQSRGEVGKRLSNQSNTKFNQPQMATSLAIVM